MNPIDAKREPEKILRLKAVMERTGLGKSSIYTKVKAGEFVSPVKISQRAVGWPASAIDAWIAERINAGSQAAAHG